METTVVNFLKNDSISNQNAHNVWLWLLGAKVGNTIIKMGDPKSFFKKIEQLRGFVTMTDLSWVNSICSTFLGRRYSQPKLVLPKTAELTIKVGVGANDVVNNNYDVVIKKMSSWPQDNPTRIYVDTEVNGVEFHYYICKNGKQGRFAKGSNEISVPFSAFIQKEMEFLGLNTEAAVINWKGVKGFYNKNKAA